MGGKGMAERVTAHMLYHWLCGPPPLEPAEARFREHDGVPPAYSLYFSNDSLAEIPIASASRQGHVGICGRGHKASGHDPTHLRGLSRGRL